MLTLQYYFSSHIKSKKFHGWFHWFNQSFLIMCPWGICGRVLMIDLDQHCNGYSINTRLTLDGVSVKINQLLTNWPPRCWSSFDRILMGCPLNVDQDIIQGLIRGINQHSTADIFYTNDLSVFSVSSINTKK